MTKTAIVTGGTRGIGRAISKDLADNDYQVFALYRSNQKSAELLEQEFPLIKTIQCDIQDTLSVTGVIKQLVSEYGQIDCLVNNAGITNDGYFMMMSEEKWRSVLETNLNGLFTITKQVLKNMKAKKIKGKIVNIASTSGVSGQAGQANYSASKGAIIALTKTLSKECAGDGINVNCVSPGFIDTEMTDRLQNKDVLIENFIPLKRFGRPEEVAWLVSFLASEKANFITGKNIVIDGGMIND